MGKDCLFCQISKGETATEFLFENDTLVVFNKKHIRSINDLTEADQPILSEMLMAARDMAANHGVAKSGYRLFINVERGGGQVIFHLHLHLIGGWNR